MSWDLVSLQLLVAIGRHRSLGRAARELGMTQPAASARLRALESRCDLNLVERSPRGSVLTPAGQELSAAAAQVLAQADRFDEVLAQVRRAGQQDLSIAASMTIAEHLVPRWIGEIRARYPAVNPVLTVANSAEVVALVRSGRVDLGFVEGPIASAGLRVRTLLLDEVLVLVTPDHPWAHSASPITQAVLSSTPMVQREPGSGTRRTFEQALGARGLVAMEASSTNAVLTATRSGIGPGVVSAIAAETDLNAGRLVGVPTELDLRRPLRAIWRAGVRLRGPALQLLDVAGDAS
ncbi:MAG TPA: LysR family transcriptional regulator [Marmoricola sp.]|nr:LysR family transcriptional regulator [Marmoricola sp.]HNN48668.1 LysR family transcriptional regulator [Marmoricola sp.]